MALLATLRRGVAAGAGAGLVYGLFVWLVVHPVVEYVEELAHDGHGATEHVVAETTTMAVSAGGGVLWGVLLGAGFGVAYYLFEPALPGGQLRAYVLAGAGFLTVSAAPWLLVPPTLPGAESSAATGPSPLLYAGMMAAGALVTVLTVVAYTQLAPKGRPVALAGAAVPLVALAGFGLATPSMAAASEAPAELAAAFTWLVVFGQAGLWTLLAAGFLRLEGVGSEARPTTDPAGYPAD